MRNFKIHVPTPEISELVQKRLFKQGFGWSYTNPYKLCNLDSPYLFAKHEKITFGDCPDFFAKHELTQVSLEEFFSMPVLPNPHQPITITLPYGPATYSRRVWEIRLKDWQQTMDSAKAYVDAISKALEVKT